MVNSFPRTFYAIHKFRYKASQCEMRYGKKNRKCFKYGKIGHFSKIYRSYDVSAGNIQKVEGMEFKRKNGRKRSVISTN